MSLKAKVEAIIYAAEEPITLEQMASLLKDTVLAELASAKENAAIERADSIAEEQASANPTESMEIPELSNGNGETICPEPGPLMPAEAATSDSENSEEITAQAQEEPVSQTPVQIAETSSAQPESSAEAESKEARPQEAAPSDNVPGDEPPAPQVSEAAATETPAEEPAPAESASVEAPETTSRKRQPKKTEQEIAEDKAVRTRLRVILVELVTDYANEDRGMEIRQVAGGFRMATKPEHHDVVRAFAKSLKPPIRLSLAALETLAVIAYKQPVTGPEIADIRGVESASVLGTLLDRKLITTAGRKQVIGRPMQYKTSKDFLLRFGLNDVNELPSMEEFSQLASEGIEITPSEPQETLSLFEPDAKSSQPAADSEATQPEPANTGAESTSEIPASDPLESPQPESPAPEALASDAPAPVEQDASDSQPQAEAESSNVPETEHPIGR
ncbi:MAG TPA: SMC-Scp complex subunit ScpB [Candidatus Saccharimonadales bacterium]|nr:SMC-Scp complex subunit ScpB [Candidatus Saccharimonadales bacterium]